MKNVSTIKKFQFFEIEKEGEGSIESNTYIPYSENISPYQMYAINGIVFLSAKIKKKVENSYKNENLILKIIKNQIVDEYFIYNKMIHYFQLKLFNNKYYFVLCGGDFKEQNVGNDKMFIFLTSIKIFEATRLLDKNHKSTERKIDSFLLKQINLLRNIENGTLYQGKDIPLKTVESIQNIISFAISNDFSHCAVGLDRGQIILIQGAPNLIDVHDKNVRMRYLTQIDTELHITNLAFTKLNFMKEEMNILYATTTKEIYFYKIYDKKEEVYELNNDSGAYSGCIAVEDEKLVVASSGETYISEYINLERGPSWFFDGKKQFTGYFKNYLTFVIYEDKIAILAVFDRINKFFAYYNNSFSKITSLCNDDESIYACIENEKGTKKIIKLNEKDNKEKFETFYNKHFFDTAYEYAKNLNYDKKKISEISRRHAYHLYNKKKDYAKAIEQYILTINYLDPSYVIQLFLDVPVLDYLIQYLEALRKDEQFKSRDPDEMKDYTALLLNCYIKQKKFKKLKEFVDEKNITDQQLNVETAIEVCKDTNQIDLALSIADKSNMVDYRIQIMIELQKSYDKAIDYIDSIKDLNKKFELLLKYGQKLLAECAIKIQKVLKEFVSQIMSMKKSGNDPLIKYENLIKIFINQENLLEELLDFILISDDNCDSSIIHRRIELYLDKLDEENKTNNESKYATKENINNIIKNKKYQNKIDKNYVLMLFKMHNFTVGIVTLSEIMELRQELLQIYMDNHQYDKIINICENFGRMENNFWIQALNYFINLTGGEAIENYIKLILAKVSENELLSPIIVLEILKKKQNMKYETVKNFVINSLQKEKKNLDKDKKEFESNFGRLEQINNEIKELKQKAKIFNVQKCACCTHPLKPPVVYFFCNHAYHSLCLNAQMKDDMKDNQCPQCDTRNKQITLRIMQAEEQANNHGNFFMELKTKPRKFDFIAEYMGKGIFKMQN